jgi:hypothetical protein
MPYDGRAHRRSRCAEETEVLPPLFSSVRHGVSQDPHAIGIAVVAATLHGMPPVRRALVLEQDLLSISHGPSESAATRKPIHR